MSWIFGHVQNGFREIRLISKFVTSQMVNKQLQYSNWQEYINISRSKNNQLMKFDHLIEFNLRNVFLEKSYKKCGKDTISRPFSKISKSGVSLEQYSKVLHSLLLLYAKLRTIETYWNYVADQSLLPHIKLFWKTKKDLELAPFSHFLYDFWKK